MSDCMLFEGQSRATYFATKIFDRKQYDRLHLHSPSGLLDDDFRYSNLTLWQCYGRRFSAKKPYASLFKRA